MGLLLLQQFMGNVCYLVTRKTGRGILDFKPSAGALLLLTAPVLDARSVGGGRVFLSLDSVSHFCLSEENSSTLFSVGDFLGDRPECCDCVRRYSGLGLVRTLLFCT